MKYNAAFTCLHEFVRVVCRVAGNIGFGTRQILFEDACRVWEHAAAARSAHQIVSSDVIFSMEASLWPALGRSGEARRVAGGVG